MDAVNERQQNARDRQQKDEITWYDNLSEGAYFFMPPPTEHNIFRSVTNKILEDSLYMTKTVAKYIGGKVHATTKRGLEDLNEVISEGIHEIQRAMYEFMMDSNEVRCTGNMILEDRHNSRKLPLLRGFMDATSGGNRTWIPHMMNRARQAEDKLNKT